MKHIRFHHQRHMFFGGGFFMGTLFILFGAALLLNVLFGFALPIVRLLLAFVFCYLGLRLLFSPLFPRTCPFPSSWNHTQWNGLKHYTTRREITHITITDEIIQSAQFQLVFSNKQGQLTVDLSSLSESVLTASERPLNLYCTTREGKTEFRLPSNISLTIFSENKRSQTYLPDGSYTHEGSHIYTSHPGTTPNIVVYTTARFGTVTFTR